MLEKVAEIFRAMMPDLPIPVTMTLPGTTREKIDGLTECPIELGNQTQDGVGFGLEHSAR